MKKILFVLVIPFAVHAQKNIQKKTRIVPDTRVQLPAKVSNKQKAREEAEALRERVLKGESMSTLAKLYSDDPSVTENSGLFSDVSHGTMVKEFEDVAFSLKPGEVSEVFETQFGFHFIELISRKNDTVTVRHILVIPKAD
jgi:peptidyl-prolyl cis-trans isomerase SurA